MVPAVVCPSSSFVKSPIAIAGMYDGASAGMVAGYTAVRLGSKPVTLIVNVRPSSGDELQGKRLLQK